MTPVVVLFRRIRAVAPLAKPQHYFCCMAHKHPASRLSACANKISLWLGMSLSTHTLMIISLIKNIILFSLGQRVDKEEANRSRMQCLQLLFGRQQANNSCMRGQCHFPYMGGGGRLYITKMHLAFNRNNLFHLQRVHRSNGNGGVIRQWLCLRYCDALPYDTHVWICDLYPVITLAICLRQQCINKTVKLYKCTIPSYNMVML